jgi:hypothetical protein
MLKLQANEMCRILFICSLTAFRGRYRFDRFQLLLNTSTNYTRRPQRSAFANRAFSDWLMGQFFVGISVNGHAVINLFHADYPSQSKGTSAWLLSFNFPAGARTSNRPICDPTQPSIQPPTSTIRLSVEKFHWRNTINLCLAEALKVAARRNPDGGCSFDDLPWPVTTESETVGRSRRSDAKLIPRQDATSPRRSTTTPGRGGAAGIGSLAGGGTRQARLELYVFCMRFRTRQGRARKSVGGKGGMVGGGFCIASASGGEPPKA